MKDEIYEYLLSLMDGKYGSEYKSSYNCTELTQKDKIIGYSYQMMGRILLRVKTNMKDIYRIEFLNYQDLAKDIKLLINSKYQLKESKHENLRTITIDTVKEEKTLMNTLHDLENVFREKMFDLYLNYSTIMTYGCCGRYLLCSNEKRCVMHDIDPIYARGCQYRKNLEAGKIFYGKNKNID